MADTKITALAELTTFASRLLPLPIVDDPAGTPATKKVLVETLYAPLFRALDATAAGSNVNTAQPWFPTNGGVSLLASTAYLFEGLFFSTRSAGTTSHTTSVLFGGTATLTAIAYAAYCKEGDTNAIADLDMVFGTANTAVSVKAASTSATENILLAVRGIVRINAAGTFIPQFQYSSAPGGAPTIQPGTFFGLWPIGSNTFTTRGSWS